MTKRTCVTASSGYSSAQAFRSASSTDALLELQRVPAEVVITDIIMPKLNGVDAISLIVQKFPMVRIVAISGCVSRNRPFVHGNQALALRASELNQIPALGCEVLVLCERQPRVVAGHDPVLDHRLKLFDQVGT